MDLKGEPGNTRGVFLCVYFCCYFLSIKESRKQSKMRVEREMNSKAKKVCNWMNDNTPQC